MENGLSIHVPVPGDFIMKLDETHSGRDSWLFVTDSNLEERIEMVEQGEYALAAPVPGYATKMPQSKQTELLLKLLKEENVDLRNFRNPENRYLDSYGGLHLVSMRLHNPGIKCTQDGLQICFSLRKGSYATVVMREIMKNHPVNRV
jgi:tRNA pseudouridine13 synthase